MVVGAVIAAAFAGYFLSRGTAPDSAAETVQTNGYVDSSACAGCHAEIAATYAETGMGRAFYPATPETMRGHVGDGVDFFHEASQRHYAIRERDGRYFLRRHQLDSAGREINVFEKEIHYVMGSGNAARSYLHRYPSGKIVELPLGWYSDQGGHFAMSPSYDRPAHHGFRREIGFECMFCHNGYPITQIGDDLASRDPLYPGQLPSGIDCQRCHGPGQAHVDAVAREASADEIRGAIFNSARASRDRQMEVCMQCHLETTSRRLPFSIVRFDRHKFSYRPDEPLSDFILHFDHPKGVREDKFEIAHAAYRFRKSACFQQSESMTCTTCHDPHKARRGPEAAEYYSGVCKSCHQDALAALVDAGKHTTAADCASCHMPKRRTDDVVRVVMTDHYIQRDPKLRNPLAPRAEHVESPDEVYHGKVELHYPARLEPTPENELYLAVAQVLEETNLDEGIPALKRLLEQHRPEQADFYFQLAEAYWHDDQPEEALPWYEQTIQKDPKHLIALRNYAASLNRLARFHEAERILRQALDVAADDPKTLTNLGDVLLQLDRPNEARIALERALAGDPDSPEPLNNLARAQRVLGRTGEAIAFAEKAVVVQPEFSTALNTLGTLLAQAERPAEAERRFQEALRWDPKYAEAHYNYAGLLAAQGRAADAERETRAAIRLQPDLAAAHSNLGNLLAMRGDLSGAEASFRKAIELQPDDPDAYSNLGTALASRRLFAEAQAQFEKALALDPDFDQARLNLAAVLAARGLPDSAREHVQRLLASDNPKIREAAAQLDRDLSNAR